MCGGGGEPPFPKAKWYLPLFCSSLASLQPGKKQAVGLYRKIAGQLLVWGKGGKEVPQSCSC